MTYIIGTAGHVDHGKSTLIEAITGTHPDRLQEERDREMSIVLGFDSFQLHDGKEISVVDVPGHRDFIENMLSGIGSIDACLLIIAADEGVMPQTREHLDILDLLEVGKGVVALTKVDLVEEEDWLDLVEEEVLELLASTSLAGSAIVRVSAKNKVGIEDLLAALSEILEGEPERVDLGRPRLSVDRVFLKAGFGSIVTGTLLDGTLATGDEISLLPGEIKGRIRGLQNHSQEVDRIGPGNRVAVNISGVEKKEIKRGDTLIHPGSYQPTRRLDVSFKYLGGIEKTLKHDTEAKLFLGADETLARIRLLGVKHLDPGGSAMLQLEVEDPVVAVRGDRFILRRPSPSETLGGGIVIDPHPPNRHKRFDQENIERLESLSGGDPRDLLIEAISTLEFATWNYILEHSGLESSEAQEILDQLLDEELVLEIGAKRMIILKGKWDRILADLDRRITNYHQDQPLRVGMVLEELKSQSGLEEIVFRESVKALVDDGNIIQTGPFIKKAGFEIEFTQAQRRSIRNLMDQFEENPTLPPSVGDSIGAVGGEVYQALVATGKLKQVSADVVFTPEGFEKMVSEVRKRIEKDGSITVALARDMFGSSRKYMLAFLERLDADGITVREGDVRRLK
jgi:selenocysteine-specific elongation factor